nr:hypothetical protein CFP56_27931 [Quercus suber]
MRQCNNAKLIHEVSAIHQDLGNLMKTVEDLANQMKVFQDLTTQMKENQVPSDLDIDNRVQVSTEVSMFMQNNKKPLYLKNHTWCM